MNTSMDELWGPWGRGEGAQSFVDKMHKLSLEGKAVSQRADAVLRARHQTLIQGFSYAQKEVHNLQSWTPLEVLWLTVGKVIKSYEGEIRVLDVQGARLALTTVTDERYLASAKCQSAKCQKVKQLAMREDWSASADGFDWLPDSARLDIQEQISI